MYAAHLPQPPSNVHRVYIYQLPSTISKEYPQLLRGIMQEGEYVDYIKRIEDSIKYSKKFVCLPIIPFILFPITAVIIVTTGLTYLAFLPVIAMICFAVSIAFVLVQCAKKNKKAMEKLEDVLKDINRMYYSRGVKWTYNSIRWGNSSLQYIDVITFTSGAPDAPPLDGVIFISNQYTVAPGASYPAPPQQSNPAASAPSKDAYMSKEAYVSVDIQPGNEDGPNPYATYQPPQLAQPGSVDPAGPYGAYPSAPPPSLQQPQVGTYPGAYPGDPSNLYGY